MDAGRKQGVGCDGAGLEKGQETEYRGGEEQ
jgi:hypothetical protein